MSCTTSLRFTPSYSLSLRFLLDISDGFSIQENLRVEVEGGILVKVERGVCSSSNLLVMPPLTDAHAHMELEDLRGKLPRKRLFEWILELIRRRFSGFNPGSGVLESARRRFYEGVLYVGEISSMGLDYSLWVNVPLKLRVYREFIRAFEEPELFPELGVSPHAIYSASERVFREVARFSRENKVPFTLHLLESQDEREVFRGRWGRLGWFYKALSVARDFSGFRDIVDYLEEVGAFGAYNPSFVHLIYGDASIAERIKESGGFVVFCPSSNLFLEGRLPPREIVEVMGPVRIGIGCDSILSGIAGSVWEEMRILYLNMGLDPVDVINMAVVGGRRAIGYETPAFSEGLPFEGVMVRVPDGLGAEDVPNFLMTVGSRDVLGVLCERGMWLKE